MKILNLIFLFLFLLTHEVDAFSKLKTYEERTFEITGGVKYFDTNSNYNSQGTKVNLLSSNKYTLYDTFLQSRYVFQGGFSISGQAIATYAESKNTDFNRTNSTFNAISVSADYMVYRGFMDFIPEFKLLYSFDPVSYNQDNVMTNEGVMELNASLRAQNNYSWLNYYVSGGFNYRNERSSLFPWELGLGIRWRNSYLGLELSGFQSVMDDNDKGTLESARYSLVQRVNGGSYRFYTINPAHNQASVNIDIGFSRAVILKTFFSSSLGGTNYSNGIYAGVGINLLFDTIANRPSTPRYEENVGPESKVKKLPERVIENKGSESEEDYQIQTDDGVDQKLFQKEPEVPKVSPAVSKRKNTKEISEEELQSQLDQ
ncbi:MAG: hypothetical protein L6Q37_14200, partial [Bdellovibrionaceae bacterium]|nr:hypothetical protein [Pseudobdellovibrionaceae bacterium]